MAQFDLALSGEELEPVRAAARALYDDLAARGQVATPDTQAAAWDLQAAGLSSACAALTGLARTWEGKCGVLQRETARISGHLEATVQTFASTEDAIRSSVHRIADGPAGADGIEANREVLRLFGLAGNGEVAGDGEGER